MEDWYQLASFPFEWWSRCRGDDIPVVGIVLDTEAKASSKGPYQVMTPYCVRDFNLQTTPLLKLGDANKSILPDNIEVELRPDGNTLSVSLVELGNATIENGYYAGMVWAVAGTELRPLAILNVYVT
ncbi:hypothetical protein [Pyxidicoccus caerfyrddinensis]|uniref:hypothetical protein n=1 Tax=Pyxidicoccus caerfyrddinensis TaxID=2709663 RepID=UPI0013D93F7C|nr:hypothetical protein [Pyxidicoccus caerfyrddinensis]